MTNNNRMVVIAQVYEGSRKIEFIDVCIQNSEFILEPTKSNPNRFLMHINPRYLSDACISDACKLSPNDWQKEVANHILVFFDVIGICKSGEAIPLRFKGSLPFLTDSIIKIKPAQVYDGKICSKGEIQKKLSFFEEKILKKMI